MITQVPELADGGYWYVVPVAADDLGGTVPDGIISDYCAWYANVGGVDCAAVRAPVLTTVPKGPPVSVADVIGAYLKKPHGRVKGA